MKNILILLLSILIFSCRKKPEVIEDSPYWGEVSAIKNGTLWNGKPVAAKSRNVPNVLDLIIDTLDKFGITESLEFYKIPLQLGRYPVTNSFAQTNDNLIGAGFYINDYDVSLGYYKVLETDSINYITLTSYDTNTKEIRGTLDATFIVHVRPDASYPDTIRFRNGVFHTKLIR